MAALKNMVNTSARDERFWISLCIQQWIFNIIQKLGSWSNLRVENDAESFKLPF